MTTERRSGMGEVVAQLSEISTKLEVHIAADAETGRKTAEMYKVLVTGNGVPSLQERTRQIESWIEGERKVIWLIVLFVIGDIGARLWQVLYK